MTREIQTYVRCCWKPNNKFAITDFELLIYFALLMKSAKHDKIKMLNKLVVVFTFVVAWPVEHDRSRPITPLFWGDLRRWFFSRKASRATLFWPQYSVHCSQALQTSQTHNLPHKQQNSERTVEEQLSIQLRIWEPQH